MAAEILQEFEPEIETVALVPSEGGRYEVDINGKLIYSKLASGRHARSGEILELVHQYLEERAR